MLKRGSYNVQQFVNLRKNYICFKLLLEFIGVRVACKCLKILYIESVKKRKDVRGIRKIKQKIATQRERR